MQGIFSLAFLHYSQGWEPDWTEYFFIFSTIFNVFFCVPRHTISYISNILKQTIKPYTPSYFLNREIVRFQLNHEYKVRYSIACYDYELVWLWSFHINSVCLYECEDKYKF